MEKDKHVIWNNDSIAHDGQEESIKEDWIGDEVGNLSYIDVNGSIPFVKDDDGYCVLEGYRLYSSCDPIYNAGDLLEALYRKMDGDTIELSVKGGELVVSESIGYVGDMEDHIVKLVDKDFVNEIERLFNDGPDKFLQDNGFDKNAVLDDVIVALAEKQGCLHDIVPAICEVYGWPVDNDKSQEAGESLDEICDAKSTEAEFACGDCGDVSGEQERE